MKTEMKENFLRYNFHSSCGCKLVSLPEGLKIGYCPLHDAASELLEAIKGLIPLAPIISTYHGLNADCPTGKTCPGHPIDEPEVVKRARLAISKASTKGKEG